MFSKVALTLFILALALAICVNAQNTSRKVPPRNTSSHHNVARHPHHHPHARRRTPPASPPPSTPPSSPPPPPPPPSIQVGVNISIVFPRDPEVQDYLDAHNVARRVLGLDLMNWDEKLVAYARQYGQRRASDCSLIHSGGPYGENLAWSSGELSAAAAVQMWVDEKIFYNYDNNECLAGEECGHYTQVVWRNSVRLGCAKTTCRNGGGTFIGCNYDPPGNYIGERPY